MIKTAETSVNPSLPPKLYYIILFKCNISLNKVIRHDSIFNSHIYVYRKHPLIRLLFKRAECDRWCEQDGHGKPSYYS